MTRAHCHSIAASIVSCLVLGACAADVEPPATANPPGLEVEILEPIVLMERARIPENDPAFAGVEVLPDRLVFALHGTLEPPIAPGDVLAGREGSGYLRTATDITERVDGRLEVATELAAITDLIQSGHFIVRYEPPAEPAEAASEELVGGSRAALTEGLPTYVLIGNQAVSLKCGGASDAGAELHPFMDLGASFELEVDVDVDWHWWGPEPELALFHLVMGGSVAAGFSVHGTGAWDAGCTVDVAGAVGLPSIELPPLTFAVAAVPIRIDHSVQPVFALTASQHVEPELFSYGASAGIGLRVGVHYEDGDWSPVWEPTPFADGWVEVGGPGAFQIADRLSLGFEYQTRIYGVAGPNIALTGFIEARVGTGEDLCTWSAGIETGVEASMSGTLEIDEGPIDWSVEVDIGSVDLVRSPLWTGAGAFPWCDGCAGSVLCRDDTGRDVCAGDRGVVACEGGTMTCTCGSDGAFAECGECVAG